MPIIHPLAYVHPNAELADDVSIGPFCYVEEGVAIGAGCVLDSHATVKRGTTLGEHNVVGAGAVLGGDPQDRKYSGEPTFLRIGDHNVFREYVTVHRATGEGHFTTVGSHCYIMAYCHLGHNVTVKDNVTIANSAGVSGHVTIEELVTIGGMVGIHQFVRVGRASMVGGFTKLTRDVPPFCVVEGVDEQVRDINAVGLRRIGISPPNRLALHKAVKLIFRSQLGMTNAIETVRRELPPTEEIEALITFLERLRRGKNGRGDQP